MRTGRAARVRARLGRTALAHNGALTVGRRGAVAHQQVLSFVSQAAPHLVKSGSVFLGHLPSDRLIFWKDAEDLPLRAIRYALLRDEFRKSLESAGD
jgi:hypothetical protein